MMKCCKRILPHTTPIGVLIFVLALALSPICYVKSSPVPSVATTVFAPNLQDPTNPLSAEAIVEEVPVGYDFPPDDGGGGGIPLILMRGPSKSPNSNSKPIYVKTSLQSKGSDFVYVKASLQSKESNFDLGAWLLQASGLLDRTNDPIILHQLGQQVLALQRGPLVDNLGLEFLEKASAQDSALAWTANNYAVQEFLINGISKKVRDLFDEARNRVMRAGENNNSTAVRNSQAYEAMCRKVSSRIAQGFLELPTGPAKGQTRFRLIQDLLLSNRLEEAQEHLNELSSAGMGDVSKHLLQGLLLKRKENFSGAAASFRIALRYFEDSNQATKDLLSSLTRMINILEENAQAAASTTNKNVAHGTAKSRETFDASQKVSRNPLHGFLRHVSWQESSALAVVRLKVRGRTINPFQLFGFCCPHFYGASTSSAFYDARGVTVPFLFYTTVVNKTVPDGPAIWQHCVSDPDLVLNPTCYVFFQNPGINTRISWTFF